MEIFKINKLDVVLDQITMHDFDTFDIPFPIYGDWKRIPDPG